MPASQLAEHSLVDLLSARARSALSYLRQLPLSFWQTALLLASLLWLAHSAAALFWLVFPEPSIPAPAVLAVPAGQVKTGSVTKVSQASLQSLKDVFGTGAPSAPVQVVQPVEPVVPDTATTTRLNLRLHGVFAASDPARGSAIIADGNDQALYSVGDEIDKNKGVKLAKVLQQRVILDNRGKFESLWLYSEEDFKRSQITRNSRRVPVAQDEREAEPGEVQPENVTRAVARPDQIPKNIGDVVRFSVHRENGKMIGYKIRPGRDRELFDQVGLQSGDVVTSVNGIEVNDPTRIRSVYKSMKTATEAQLTVLREGVTHSISITLDSEG